MTHLPMAACPTGWCKGGWEWGHWSQHPCEPRVRSMRKRDSVTWRRGCPGRGKCPLQCGIWLQGQDSSEFRFHRIKPDP